MDKKNLAFDKVNFILLGVGFAIVVLGFILMAGGGTDDYSYNPEIFSAMRIKVAPVVCFVGFISMIYAVIRKPKDSAEETTSVEETSAEEDNSTVETINKEVKD